MRVEIADNRGGTGFTKCPPSHFLDFSTFDAAFTWTGGDIDRPAFVPVGSTYKVENQELGRVLVCGRVEWIG